MGVMRVDNDCCINNKYHAITHVISYEKEKDVRNVYKYTILIYRYTLLYIMAILFLYSTTVNYTFISLLPTTKKKQRAQNINFVACPFHTIVYNDNE